MDHNDGVEARTSKEEIRITKMMDLQEVFPQLFRISLHGQISHVEIPIRTIDDQMTNSQISLSIQAIETDLEMDLLTIKLETGETMAIFPVLHRLKGKTSHKVFHIVNQEVICPKSLLSADMTVDLRPKTLVSRPTKKSFRKTIIRHHLMRFASPQPTIPLTNYQIFAR